MKKTISIILTATIVTILLASSAFAWQATRIGQRNFERAWSAFMYKRTDAANQYFSKAADSFADGLAQKPPSRSTMFASNLAMAGISLYYAGRYQEAITTMEKAKSKDDSLWEAPLYSALSYAAEGNKTKTIEQLTAYLKANPSQAILSTAVAKQLSDLEDSSTTLNSALSTIDGATFEQFSNNVTLIGKTTSSTTGHCSGTYWWRYNKAPCKSRNIQYR